MSSFISAIILTIPILFLFSSRLEKSRIVTVSRPLVITQARKTPAFILYQQAQMQNNKKIDLAADPSTFISTESLGTRIEPIVIAEMRLAQHEIGAPRDFGFQVATYQKQNIQPALAAVISENAQLSVQLNSSPLKKWGTVRGKFEVKDGVGIVDHIVEIKRIEEGQVRELGRVDLQAGSYSIDIETPQGVLIAQVKDKSGLLIGEDEQRMINLQSHGSYFEGPFIRVGKPVGIAANTGLPSSQGGTNPGRSSAGIDSAKGTYAGNTRGKGKPQDQAVNQQNSSIVASLFSKQHQLENPQDQFQNVSKNSSTISIVEDQKKIHESIITIRQTADISETPLFTKKWVQGAKTFIADQMKIEFKNKNSSVLIGKILRDGVPGTGVKVQIENQPGLSAIYLDQFMIPSLKQESTSENGYFMFVGLEPDSYSVAALIENKIIGQQIFIAEEGYVAYQHIVSVTNPRSVVVRSFDAFTGEPQDADVIIPDYSDIIETTAGSAIYKTHNQLGIANYIVRPKQNYMPTNYIQDSRKDHLHIPLITEDWLSSLQSQLQINDQPDTGTVVGFVPDFDFDIYLISEVYDTKQVVYFSANGTISATAVAGGGFVLFNVPRGAQEVVVQEKKTERIFSQVHLIKANQTSISHFNE